MLRLIKSSAFLLLAVAFTLSLSACDSSGSNEEEEPDIPEVDDGEVAVSIDGDASGSFDGYAYFYEDTDPETGESMFSLVLNNTDTESPNSSGQFIWIARESGQPSTGQYSFANFDQENDDLQPDEFAAFAVSIVEEGEENTLPTYFFSTGGTLTLTTSTDSKVAGHFEIDATVLAWSETEEGGLNYEEGGSVTLEGAFDADEASSLFVPEY